MNEFTCPRCLDSGHVVYGPDTEGGRITVPCDHGNQQTPIKKLIPTPSVIPNRHQYDVEFYARMLLINSPDLMSEKDENPC